MSAPFQAYLNPGAGQYNTPSPTTANPNPVMASASNPLGWANINTTAPWITPDGTTGQNPSFSAYGASHYQNPSPDLWNGFGATNIFGGLFGQAKKRSSPDFTAPSYQGTLFNPDTGPYAQNYGSNYGMSPEAQASQAPVSSNGQQNNTGINANAQSTNIGNFTGPQYQGESGLQSSQNYIGQSPYGLAGGTYVPGQGQSSASYGGYGNYGGYANSASGISPYVPGQ